MSYDPTKPPHYPKVGSKYRIYDATIEVTYAQHGAVVLSRGGKFEVQMSPREFWNWVDEKARRWSREGTFVAGFATRVNPS